MTRSGKQSGSDVVVEQTAEDKDEDVVEVAAEKQKDLGVPMKQGTVALPFPIKNKKKLDDEVQF